MGDTSGPCRRSWGGQGSSGTTARAVSNAPAPTGTQTNPRYTESSAASAARPASSAHAPAVLPLLALPSPSMVAQGIPQVDLTTPLEEEHTEVNQPDTEKEE
ncbi:hypothetical protein N7528_009114 [Penicillium herquei]|nr:hypothetical protein N7528_009114 [Penicillium herquei]